MGQPDGSAGFVESLGLLASLQIRRWDVVVVHINTCHCAILPVSYSFEGETSFIVSSPITDNPENRIYDTNIEHG